MDRNAFERLVAEALASIPRRFKTAMQNIVNSTVPDFVPFKPAAGDPGLRKYSSHYLQSGVATKNGLGGQKETGGDVGGCIEPVGPPPGVLNCHQ